MEPRIQDLKDPAGIDTPAALVIDVDEDGDLGDVAALLADDCARCILAATATEGCGAEELAERCEVSTPTIYRRLERLREAELVAERTAVDDDGHHRSLYRATFDRAVVELDEEGFDVRLRRRDRMADRFRAFVEDHS